MSCLLAFSFEPSIHLPAGGRSSISPVFLAFCKGLCYTFCRTEQKTTGAFRHFAPSGGGRNVKREAGANPARSRHCDKGVHCQGAFAPVTEPSGLGRRQRALSFESGNLPAVGTGALPPQITRNWLYQKACKIRGLFALPFRKQKAPFLQPLFPVPFCSVPYFTHIRKGKAR